MNKIHNFFNYDIIFITLILISTVFVYALDNPAAEYCTDLGYNYETINNADGSQSGICHVHEFNCDEWDFYNGECATNYYIESKKVKNTTNDKKDTSNSLTGLVVHDNQKKGLIEKWFIGLQNLITGLVVAPTASSSFDWRSYNGQNWVSPIKNQGGCGSCSIFSSVAVAESRAKIDLNNSSYNIDLSEQDIVSCAGGGNCNNGWTQSAPINYMKNTGVVKESCFGYTHTNNACSNKCSNWQNERMFVTNFNYLPADVNSIKQAINDYGPVTVEMDACDDFDSYSGGIYTHHHTWVNCGLHSLAIIGYSDADGYWILKNSWGPSWGESGYIRVNYSETVLTDNDWNNLNDYRTLYLGNSYAITGTDISTYPTVNGANANITISNSATNTNFSIYAKPNSIKQLSSVKINGTSMTGSLQYGGTFSLIKPTSYFGCQNMEGNCILTMNVSDDAGKSVTSQVTVTVDDMAPKINLISPKTGYNSNNVVFSYNVSDRESSVNCLLYLNGAYNQSMTANTNAQPQSFSPLNLADGSYSWYVNCTDALSNSNITSSQSFVIDTTPPTISISSPVNKTYSNSTILIDVAVDDLNLENKWWSDNGAVNQTFPYQYGLVGYWGFEEGSGLTVIDSYGLHDGTTYGNPVWTNGTVGKALSFDGSNDYVELTDFNVGSNFSISLWVNADSTATSPNAGQSFIAKHTSGGENIFYLGYWDNSYCIGFTPNSYCGGNPVTGWQHLVLIAKEISPSQTNVKLYRNGTLILQYNFSSVFGDISGKPWVVGQEWDQGGTSDFFKGIIDEVAIYNRELTLSEVTQQYNDELAGKASCIGNSLCGTLNYNFTEGQHTLFAYANDSAGNLNSTSVTFIVDTVPPSISIVSPQSKNYNNKTLLLNISVIDATIDKIWYVWNGTTFNYTIPIYITFNEDGNNITVYANDTAGYMNQTNVTFNIDTIFPWFDSIPTTQVINYSQSFEYQMSIYDNINISAYFIDDTSNFVINQSGYITNKTSLSVRVYSLNITVNDTSDNKNSTKISITVKMINSLNVTENTSTTFDLSPADTNITLLLSSNVTTTLTIFKTTPNSTPSSSLNTLKAINIMVDNATSENLTWAIIKIFYNASELTTMNTDESTLKIYYYNESASSWQLEPNQGIDTTNDYVWANVTHFSLFGAFGIEIPYCGDGNCNGEETCSSCSSDCGSCSSGSPSGGGGSGGGGGGGGGVLVSNNPSKSKYFTTLNPRSVADMIINKNSIDVTEIDFTVNKQLSKVTLSIETIFNESVIPLPIPNVYSYFKIKLDGAAAPDINSTTFNFKINNTWLKDYDKNTVSLNRYTDSWTKLNTYLVSEDSDYTYYTSTSPGFSYFAITAEKQEVIPKKIEVQKNISSTEENMSKTAEEEKPENIIEISKLKGTNETNRPYFIFAVISLLIIGSILFLIFKRESLFDSLFKPKHKKRKK